MHASASVCVRAHTQTYTHQHGLLVHMQTQLSSMTPALPLAFWLGSQS